MDKLVTGDSTKKQSISLEKKNMAITARKKEEVLPLNPCISYLGDERDCESQVSCKKTKRTGGGILDWNADFYSKRCPLVLLSSWWYERIFFYNREWLKNNNDVSKPPWLQYQAIANAIINCNLILLNQEWKSSSEIVFKKISELLFHSSLEISQKFELEFFLPFKPKQTAALVRKN